MKPKVNYDTFWCSEFNGKIKEHNLKYLLNFMSLNSAKYQQIFLQYLQLFYFINHWWTIE